MALTASAELPLYLQMGRYTKGSKAVMELRTQHYLAGKAEKPAETANATDSVGSKPVSDDELTTASIGSNAAETENLSFDAWLDVINPLQHIPGVSTLYREVTGDELNPAARVVGGGLFGGPLGAGLSLMESLLEEASGLDVGGHVASWFTDDTLTSPAGSTVADRPGDIAPTITNAAAVPRATQTTPLPTLSPEMFEALLTDSQGAQTPARSAAVPPIIEPATTQATAPSPVALTDFAAAMERGLDLYREEHEEIEPAE